jgi:hypothetical protein
VFDWCSEFVWYYFLILSFRLFFVLATYGTVFFADSQGIKEFIMQNVTLIQSYPAGLRLYSLRSAVGTR